MLGGITHPWIFAGAVFFGTAACAYLAIALLMRRFDVRVDRRFEELRTPQTAAGPLQNPLAALLRAPELPRLAASLVPNEEQARSEIQAQLVRAGMYERGALVTFFTARLTLMLLPPLAGLGIALLGLVPFNLALMAGAAFGGCGLVVPGIWLDSRIARRQHVLRRALADFLDLFVACVESGMTLQAMIGRVSEELAVTHPELASEFAICHRQVQLGHSLEAATSDLAERTGVEDLRFFSTFVRQSLRYGTTLGQALRELSDMLRTQREMRAEELAQKASVKILLPTLLFIFPAVFVVLAAPAAIRIHESMSRPAAPAAAASRTP